MKKVLIVTLLALASSACTQTVKTTPAKIDAPQQAKSVELNIQFITLPNDMLNNASITDASNVIALSRKAPTTEMQSRTVTLQEDMATTIQIHGTETGGYELTFGGAILPNSLYLITDVHSDANNQKIKTNQALSYGKTSLINAMSNIKQADAKTFILATPEKP